MANSIGDGLLSPALWSARIQHLLHNSLISGAIANTEERAGLKFGYRVHRPYTGDVYAMDYTRDTVPTFQDMVATDEFLDVDQAKIVPLYLDDIDDIQNKYNAMNQYATRSAYQLRNDIDQTVLAQVTNALLSNSAAVSLTTSNVFQKFSEAKAAMFNNGVEDMKPWYAAIDGDTVSVIEQTLAFNGFRVSDDVMVNGWGIANYLGDWAGLHMYRTQNLPTALDVVWSNNPTNAQTFILNGVTFTFVSSLGSTAGNVVLDGAVDNTMASLVLAINGGAVGSVYVQLSDSDRAKLAAQGVTASYDAGTNTLSIAAAGKMTLTGDFSNGVKGTQTMDLMIAQMGNVDLVIQDEVDVRISRVTDGRQGQIATAFTLYGTKMFREGAQRTYKMTINKA
jgi:hypothetical protein